MSEQISLLENPGYPAMLAGMKLAQDNAREEWRSIVRKTILEFAQAAKKDFTLDRIAFFLKLQGVELSEYPNAVGGIVHKLVREGYLRGTGEFRHSAKKDSHCRMIRVYDYVDITQTRTAA